VKKIVKLLAVNLVFGFCLAFPEVIFAHTLWLNVSDYSPEFSPEKGAETNVYFGWGHHYPVDDFLSQDRLEEFSLITPDGGEEKLKPNPGGFLATRISLKKGGGYIVSAVRKPGFYTMHIDKGKIHHKLGSKTGLKKVILSIYSRQYAKALVNVADAEDDSFSKPVGHKLEIVPLENPFKIHGCGGHFLKIKVLFDGKPARFCKVYATYAGFSTGEDFAYATSTNSEGIAKIRIIHWGQWLIKVNKRLPAPEDLKDKCNELSYTATLTFEIP